MSPTSQISPNGQRAMRRVEAQKKLDDMYSRREIDHETWSDRFDLLSEPERTEYEIVLELPES